MKKYLDRFAFDYAYQREGNVKVSMSKSKFQLFYAINDNGPRIISDNFLAGFSLSNKHRKSP